MKWLLILSVSAGAGHTRAAEALEEAARKESDRVVRHVDILEFTGRLYRKTYVQSYLEMVNHAPELWGYFYRASDHPKRFGRAPKLVQLFDKLEFTRFRRFVRDFHPDFVLATHFLAGQVFAPYRRRGRDRFPLGLVLTDFDAHAYWVQPTADRFFVASAEVAASLAGSGIPRRKIAVTGIPIARRFSKKYNPRLLRSRLGLAPKAPVVLAMSGAAGGSGP